MADTATEIPIATNTLGSAANTLTFSSIPQTYTDLVLVCNNLGTVGGDDTAIRFNGDTATNYSDTLLYGSGSVAGSGRHSAVAFGRIGYASSTGWGTVIANFQNYSNATTYKTVVSRSSLAAYEVDILCCMWRSTAAITSIEVKTTAGGNFAAGSIFTLYGIL
jgi:hypothetical protein